MNGGTITNNSSNCGGGVYDDGSCTMNSGSITNNTGSAGGGVYAERGKTFTMNDGSITGNTAKNNNNGGDVYVNGTFNLNAAKGKAGISGNKLSGSGTGAEVFVYTAQPSR